jgi:ribulose-5-phosphate 4-epimerase/fuculose-1-phosphate aldolase
MRQTAGVKFETVFLSKNPPDDNRTDQLIYWCRRFDKLGLAPKSAGNLSFRTKEGFIITATGVELRAVEKDNLVEVQKVEMKEGRILVHVKGKVVPSKESVLHRGVYDLRPEINAVFHTHDQLVLESTDKLKLPCTEGEQPRGSYELAKEVQRILGLSTGARYLVLRNHGVVSMGESMEEAGRLAEDMNKMAQNISRKEGRK